MDVAVLVFLSSGLFLGWSLGANDAANVFGTAVGSRMIKFGTAALICSVFVILGAIISGAGAAHTLGKLGAVNALPGSFMAALAAAVTVLWMTKLGLPVSTSQAVVGAIIGWNLFSDNITDFGALTKIIGTWVFCPILGMVFAMILYPLTKTAVLRMKLHLLRQDHYTRLALIVAGAFGAYALGANNIANVMGVFVKSSPFTDFNFAGLFSFSSIQQLFLVGGIAIAVGVYTYSKRVMMTVGDSIVKLTPVAAFVVVVAQSIVLFLFASQGLEYFLASNGLPTIPLVPVSSSQAVVGAVIGIGLLQGGRNIRWSVLGRISSGWISTPVISALICFIFLFFLQNVFNQVVFKEVDYTLSEAGLARLTAKDEKAAGLSPLVGETFRSAVSYRDAVRRHADLGSGGESKALETAELHPMEVTAAGLEQVRKEHLLADGQLSAVEKLEARRFAYKWELVDALAVASPEWKMRPASTVNKLYNNKIREKLDYLIDVFSLD